MKRLILCLVVGVSLTNCVIKPDENTGALYPSPLVLTELKVTLAHASLFVGESTTALATGTDQFANPIATGPVTYSSSSAAATITQDGLITTVAPGNVTITATTATKHAETLLTIAARAVLASLQITLPNASVRVAQTATAMIDGKDQYGIAFAPTTVLWSSSATNVATISQGGAVTGVAIGQTTLTATSQGVTASLPISVVSATPVVQLVTLAGERRVRVGDPYQYLPTITLSDGSTANLPVTYSVSPADAGNISPNGILTPIKIGTMSVIATVNNVPFATTVVGYDWSVGPGATTYTANITSDSVLIGSTPQTITSAFLGIDCSQLDQPQSIFNIFLTVSATLGAGSSVQYSIDDGPLRTNDWIPNSVSNRFNYPANSTADRVAFANALARGKSLRVIWTQSLQGPITAKFRLTGMAAAIAPVLAACGLS